jgi:hypothetical protein
MRLEAPTPRAFAIAMLPLAWKQVRAALDPIAGTRLTVDGLIDDGVVDASDLDRWDDDGGRQLRRQIWIRTR